MFIKELVQRCFRFMEEGIAHPRYSAAHCRRQIRAQMCEAGERTLLESLKIKGADIPPQSEQRGGDDSDSDAVVEVQGEITLTDLAAEQGIHSAQIKNLWQDVDGLKDAVFKGGEGLVKVTTTVSTLFTAFQQFAAKLGFKLPMGALEGLNMHEAADSTAAAPPPAQTVEASAPAAGTKRAQGAPSGAQTSAAGHTGIAAAASSSAAGRPVAAACVTRVVAGQPSASAGAPAVPGQPGASAAAPPAGPGRPGASTGAPPAGAGQPGASAGAPPAGAGQPGASAAAPPAGAGQPGASAGAPPPGEAQPGAASGIPTSAACQPGAAAGVTTTAAGQTGAAAGVPTAAAGQTGAAAGVPTAAAGQTGAAAGVPMAATGQTGAAAGVPTTAAGQTGAAAGVPMAATGQTGAAAGVPTVAAGQTGAEAGVPTAAAVHPGAAAVAPTTTQALPGATAWDSMAYEGQQGPSTSATYDTCSGAAKKTTDVHHLGLRVPSGATVPHQESHAPPASTVWAPGLEARVQAATGWPINAAVVQPRNDAWDIGGPHTDLTIFHPGVLVQGAVRSEAADETARAVVVQTGSSAWSSGKPFFAPSAFPPGVHIQGARPPCAVGYAPHAGGVQPVATAAAAPSGLIGHALQPRNVLYLGSGQPHASVQLPLSSHRPLVHDSTAFLVSDEALDNVSGLRRHTSASHGRTLSSILSGFVQGSQPVMPSPAASTSMIPSTQGGENEEEATSRRFTGVIKKKDKDE
ncbi:unnamed protein product [Closterium sp. Naga37s-1]|nr:unnamed protein product [Closterium sp. Naga37s-1]